MNPNMRLAGLVLGALVVRAADERFPFVIPGDDASASVTNMAALSPRAAGADGFVRIRDGHFSTDAGRLRFWGVNTCFGANFPEHADAEKAAAHLAKLGVNAVRLHHHDTSPAPRGIWGPVVNGRRTLDAAQVEKQDYFLNELHHHGIYANLNLHVGREVGEAEGVARAELPYAVRYDKYLLYFEPRMREQLKVFCRDYLLHENPYRKLRRVDDPGIAMIEITNENSFSTLGPAIAAGLPEPHRGEFKRQWNAWLARTYPNTAALRRAWGGANEPLGPALADAATWREGAATLRVKESREFPVRVSFGQPGPQPDVPALLVEPHGEAPELSTQELHCPNLTIAPGRIVTLSFWVKAAGRRTLSVDLSNAGPGNWNAIGYHETLQVGPDWQRVRRVFRTSDTIPGGARIAFKFGGNSTAFSLAGLTLRPGGDWIVVPEGQTIEAHSIEIPVAGWSEPAQRDARRFMADTETEFIRDLTAFLKNDLGVKVPITASQITYHGAEIVARTCDYADIHAYWQHPRFPRKPWDPVDWDIRNTPMERAPESDAILARAPWRLLDRPFTMSEWNIPDPHDYAASVVPFAALVAGLQDWDGIFFFQYQSGGEGGWYADKVQRFFSFNGQPVKLALLAAFAPMFRRGDLAPLTEVAAGTTEQRVPATLGLSRRIGIDPKAGKGAASVASSAAKETTRRFVTPGNTAIWDASTPHAHVILDTPATRGVWGIVGGSDFLLDGVRLKIGVVERDYAVVVLTSLDGAPLNQTKRALLAAVGSAQNTGMTWNDTRTSVGNAWGTGPAQVNGVPVELTLPRGGARVFALDGRGQRLGEVIAADGGAGAQFKLGAEFRTLWYEVMW